MKRRDLIVNWKNSAAFSADTARNTIGTPVTKQSQPVPRHNEINENLAKSILRKLKSEGK